MFLIRYWYNWLSASKKIDLDSMLSKLSPGQKHSKKKTKQQYFITLPSMFSIEINSHTLVYLGLLVIQQQLPIECLNISIFNSQSCENIFRLSRAMSGTFSSIVNFSVYEFLQRAQKLSYIESIKCRTKGNSSNAEFLFPRHHKLSKSSDGQQATSSTNSNLSLSLVAIENNILRAYADVCQLVVDVNMYKQNEIFSLEKLSKLAFQQLLKSRIIDYSSPDTYDSDFYSDSDESSSEDDEIDPNDSDQEQSFDDNGDGQLENLANVSTSTFEGMRIVDKINPALDKSYFVVGINGVKKYLNKQTATWLLSKEKFTLSSDRLKRVMTVNE